MVFQFISLKIFLVFECGTELIADDYLFCPATVIVGLRMIRVFADLGLG